MNCLKFSQLLIKLDLEPRYTGFYSDELSLMSSQVSRGQYSKRYESFSTLTTHLVSGKVLKIQIPGHCTY
jgi:hypothetical protein